MADQTTNALLGICKTLGDVVVPAVSADDPLAQQELRMAVRYLEFLRQRVDHLYARARFEVGFNTELAVAVRALLDESLADGEALDEATRHGRELLASPGASTEELRACSAALTLAVSDAVLEQSGEGGSSGIERAVLAASGRLTAFERSWYLPLGLDHFADEVAPLKSFLPPAAPPPEES